MSLRQSIYALPAIEASELRFTRLLFPLTIQAAKQPEHNTIYDSLYYVLPERVHIPKKKIQQQGDDSESHRRNNRFDNGVLHFNYRFIDVKIIHLAEKKKYRNTVPSFFHSHSILYIHEYGDYTLSRILSNPKSYYIPESCRISTNRAFCARLLLLSPSGSSVSAARLNRISLLPC